MDTLETLLREYGFRGRARRVRCFAHTLNLTAKATIRQFERKKGKKKNRNDNENEPDFDELPLLESIIADEDDNSECDDAGDESDHDDNPALIDIEDAEDGSDEGVRSKEEIVNVFETLTVEEQERWKMEVKPIRSAIYKVSQRWCDNVYSRDSYQQTRRIAFKIINSPTLLLPQWHDLLRREAPSRFHERSLPHDVSTCWNSTFNHLAAFSDLQTYIDKFTSIRDHGLREFELTREEWECVRQLVKVLQVSRPLYLLYVCATDTV